MLKSGAIPFEYGQFCNDYLNEPDISFKLEPTWPHSIEDEAPEMKFNVESGLPIPPKQRSEGLWRDLVETMKDMQPGQSLFVPVGESRTVSNIQLSLTTAKRNLNGQAKGWVFTSRKTKTEPFGVRIWRLE